MKTTLTCLTLAVITTVTAPAWGQLRFAVPEVGPVHRIAGVGLPPLLPPAPRVAFSVTSDLADSFVLPPIEASGQWPNPFNHPGEGTLRASYSATIQPNRADFLASGFIQYRAPTDPLRFQFGLVSFAVAMQVKVDERVDIQVDFRESRNGDWSRAWAWTFIEFVDPETEARQSLSLSSPDFPLLNTGFQLLPGIKYEMRIGSDLRRQEPAGPFSPGQTEYTSWTSMDWSLSLVVVPSPGSVAIVAAAIVLGQVRRRREADGR